MKRVAISLYHILAGLSLSEIISLFKKKKAYVIFDTELVPLSVKVRNISALSYLHVMNRNLI